MRTTIEENGKFYSKDEDGIHYDNEIKEIKVCGCDNEHQVPLIWTYAFMGAEYWCPFCGNNYGMMGAGESVPITKEIFERGEKYKKLSKEFLDAKSSTICSSLMFEGKRISPEELPDKEKKRMLKVITNWKYGVKL